MRALITGITGQDGSYLAELLIKNKYEVHGIVRGNNLNKENEVLKQHIAELQTQLYDAYKRIEELNEQIRKGRSRE
mgnify:CR=1 FL=1